MGRSMRSRSADNVLAEIEHQARLHAAASLVFTDLKLNSHLPTWYGLVERLQGVAPGTQWIASVHIAGAARMGSRSSV
jgi:hypothetical protein